jgi:hypothetical protein
MSNYVHEVEPISYGLDDQEGINQNLGPVISDVHTGTFRDGDLIADHVKTLYYSNSFTPLQTRGSVKGIGGNADFKGNGLVGLSAGAAGISLGYNWDKGRCEISLKGGVTKGVLFMSSTSTGYAIDFCHKSIKGIFSQYGGIGFNLGIFKGSGGSSYTHRSEIWTWRKYR